METAEQIKETIRQKYGAIAQQPYDGPADARLAANACCDPGRDLIAAINYSSNLLSI